ncbi:MAG TPA: hypothetical protein VJ894_01270 [Cryomorphaceae bacterium]|nr:hypothetical protein [Cryomorphaceae bacterium]
MRPSPKLSDNSVRTTPSGETAHLLTIKVEELTHYIIELKKEIDTLREEVKC